MTEPAAPWRCSAAELRDGYRAGTFTPLDVARACLARVDAVNPTLNAIVARRDAGFLADAEAAGARIAAGRALSALDGVPFTAKDNLLTHDLPTTWGTPGLVGVALQGEELAVTRLRAAGALLLGKTNTPEFALEGVTTNPVFGATRHPVDPGRTPGGSSGGAVAAVASGMGPIALGTDGGGSTRRPAAHCGLVGLRPGLGAVPRKEVLPPLLLDFEEVGVIARDGRDASLVFDVIAEAGPDIDESRAARILFVPQLGAHPVDPQIAASVAAALDRLRDAGHAIDTGSLPLDLAPLEGWWTDVGAMGLAWLFERHPALRDAASRKWRAQAAQAGLLPATRLWSMLDDVRQLRLQADALFAGHDFVITPANAALPWPVEEPYPEAIAGQAVGPRGHAVFTAWVNATGLPAIALPCTPSREGWPIGLQVVGPRGSERRLLALARAWPAGPAPGP